MSDEKSVKLDSIYNLVIKRKMALMALDFSFYNKIVSEGDFKTSLFFNKLFAIIKSAVSSFGGVIELVYGDSCVISFSKYCAINVSLVACQCAKLIMQKFHDSFKDDYSEHNIYISIAIHCDYVYRASFDNKENITNTLSGSAMHILQKILGVTPPNMIYYSENVLENINYYVKPIPTSCIYSNDNTKQTVYQLDEFMQPEPLDTNFGYPDIQNKFSGIISSINKKMQPYKAIIYETKSTNMYNCFFQEFFKQYNNQYILLHSSINENQHSPINHVLLDFYLDLQELMKLPQFQANKRITSYKNYLRECFSFDQVDYQTSVCWESLVYAFMMLLRCFAETQKVIITVENVNNFDETAFDFFAKLIVAMNNADVFFIFVSDKEIEQFDSRYCSYIPLNEYNLRNATQFIETICKKQSSHLSNDFTQFVYNATSGNIQHIEELIFYLQQHDLIDSDNRAYVNVATDLDSLIEYKLSLLTENQQKIANILCLLHDNVNFEIFKEALPEINVIDELVDMYDKKIILMRYESRRNTVKFFRQNYIKYLQAKLTPQAKKDAHRRIAKSFQISYAHSLQKFYYLLAYHYEQAEMFDQAIYYTFAAAICFREHKNRIACRKFLQHALDLAEKTDAYQTFHTFTEEEFEFFDYQDYKKYFRYRCKLPVSLDLIYYFYAKTFSLHETEALEFLQKAYQYAKKFNRDFTTILSCIHYFIYKCYNDKIACVEYLQEATQIATRHEDVFMMNFINMAYMEIIFAECPTELIGEDEILDIFFEAKNSFNSSLTLAELFRRALNVYFYSTYAFYLKRSKSELKKIIHSIRNADKYLIDQRDKIEFYHTVASGFGPLVGTVYQLPYTKKELIIALKYNNLRQAIQYKATVGYQYMLMGRYEKSLKYYQSSKNLSEATYNLREMHMAYKNLGDLYNCLQNYEEAKFSYNKCLDIPIVFDDSHKMYVDFADPIFPKSALAFTLIKTDELDEARKLIKEVESSMTNIFFGSEIPIFLTFLRCYLSLIVNKYDQETIKVMQNCYFDMKRISPNAIQLVWIKRELQENGIVV